MRILLIFILILTVVALKIAANPAYYLTPDSHYYLQAAQNLLDGRGYRIDFYNKDTFCAIWPVGYSLLIAGVTFLTTLSVTLSSKVVNLLAVAGILWLVKRHYKAQSWFVALAMLSSSFLQLYSNTWSETVFIFCLLGVVFSRGSKVIGTGSFVMGHGKNHISYFITNISYLITAFLTRYVGIFLFIPLLIQRKYKTALVFAVVVVLYLLNNYAQTQTFTGNHGHFPTEPFVERLVRGLKGIGEEIAFWGIRDWDLKGGNGAMTIFIYVISIAQATILVVVGSLVISHLSLVMGRGSISKQLKSQQMAEAFPYHTSYVLQLTSLSYFATSIVLYLIDDSMESLYFRRLAPATFLILIAGLGWLVAPTQKLLFERVKWWVVTFFILSVVHALPKIFLIEYFMKIMQ